MKGKKKKSNGCQSEVMPLLCLLLWQAELSSLNEFVVCLEQATSFITNSQNTTPHLNPMPYESWSSSKDSLFPSETGILSWLGGLFSGDLLWGCLGVTLRCVPNRYRGTGWASNEHCDMHSCHALTIFQARKQTLLQSDPALVIGGLVVSLEAAFCPLGQNLGSLLCFMQLSRALVEGFGGWLGAVFTCHKAATNSNCAIIDVVTSKVLRRKKQGSCQATAWK